MSGPAFTFNADIGALAIESEKFLSLSANLQDRVISRAIVTLKRRIGPEVNRQLSAVLNLSTRQINQRTTVTSGPDYVDVTASGKRIPLSQFGGKYGGRKTAGATAEQFRDDPRKTYVSAFTIKGQKAIVARQLISGNKRVARGPLRQLYGTDIGSVFVSTDRHQISSDLNDFAEKILDAEVPRLIQVEIDNA